MEVVDCNIMEEIVGREKEDDDHLRNEAHVIIEFNKMRSLTLQSLPKLVGFSSKVNTTTMTNELSQMNQDSSKIIEKIDVDLIKLFSGEVFLPSLETLYLSSIPSNILWHDQLSSRSSSWVKNLKTLEVSKCDGLKFLLSSSMASSMEHLKDLEIRECQTSMEKISLNQGDCALIIKEDVLFGKLESMRLVDLPNLVSFSSTSHYSNFQTGLAPQYTFFDGMVQFPSLLRLELSGLNTVTMIWHNKLPLNSFCALKEVKIENCRSVETFAKHHHAFRLNLNSIKIKDCSNLKNVIPASLAGSFQELEQLVVLQCGILDEIVQKEEDQETNQLIMFEFPKLKFVKFLYLPQLRSFYGGMHSSKWPSLTHLKVVLGRNNNKVQILAKEHLSFQEKCKMDNPCTPIKQPLFLIEKESFPNLKKLTLSASMEVCDDPITAGCLNRVKDFWFDCNIVNSSNIFLSNCFRYFHNSLEGLYLKRASFLEIFLDDDIEQEFVNNNSGWGSISEPTVGTLAHIKALSISRMPWLTNLWKENSQLSASVVLLVLSNLEYLQVGECDRLKNIVSSAISFCNLTNLLIVRCQGLKYLVTYPVAKSLNQLKSMTIRDCKRMRVILESRDGDDDDDDDDDDDGSNINSIEIVFVKLRFLELNSLPSLGGFCSENDHCCVKVPSLQTLYVRNCNIELKISDKGVLQTHSNLERLQQITAQLDADDDEALPIQDTDVSLIHKEIDIFYDNDETLYEHSQKWLAMC